MAGFTLIELMVVILVLAILAGIAYASYENATIASRRKAAAVCLLEASQFLERYYTTNLTYVGAVIPALPCRAELAASYQIPAPTLAATTFTLSIAPVAGSRQAAKDGAKCGTLGLNQAGTKTRTGSAALGECW
jgi:type IV pilus assembly protein PilE